MRARRPYSLGLVAFAAWACGADNAEAPRPPPAPQSCKSFEALTPALQTIIAGGKLADLASVISGQLVTQDPRGDPAPAADVLRAVVGTLSTFAAYPPEPGAPTGLTCVPDGTPPPPLSLADPLCEVRRSLYSLVHQGNGISALRQVDPLLSGVLDYVVGRAPSSSQPHYEVAGAIASLCQQSAVCSMNDTLDVVIGLSAFLEQPEGKKMLDDINTLVNDPQFQTYLTSAESTDGGQSFGGEDGVVALAKILIQIVQGMQDPSALDQIPVSVFPAALQQDIKPLIADLKLLLDPNRTPNVLAPTKRALSCLSQADTNNELIRMVYRLSFVANLPAFQFSGIVGAVEGLRQTDQRGSLLYLLNLFATAIRNDPSAPTSAAAACSTLFSTQTAPGNSRSNAELSLPAVADIFEAGVAGEAVCAIDTLVYGCAGGMQPACP